MAVIASIRRVRLVAAYRLRWIHVFWMIARLRVSYRQAFYIGEWIERRERGVVFEANRALLDTLEARLGERARMRQRE